MKVIERIPQELLDATNEFAKQLEWSRRLPLFEVHKWWARRYSGIVKLFLVYSYLDYSTLNRITDLNEFVSRLYWSPPKVNGKTFLDPFCGGGTIVIEAAKLGFEAYGIEINKLAYLILDTYKELKDINSDEFKREIIKFAREINDELWKTKCTRGHDAITIHTFLAWKDKEGKLQIKYNKIKDINNDTSIYYCEKCNRIFEEKADISYCRWCGNEFNKQRSNRIEHYEIYPYAIEYYCPTCGIRNVKKVEYEDLKRFFISKSRNKKMKIPLLNETKRLINNGIEHFNDLLTPRQEITLSRFIEKFSGTKYEKASKLIVSNSLRCCSLLAYYSPKYKKVIPGFVIKSYWLPNQPVELNPLSFRENGSLVPLGRGNLISSYMKISKVPINEIEEINKYKVYLGAAQDILKKVFINLDLVFTDPPYADYQYYSDLSLFNLSFLQELDKEYIHYLVDKEIVLRKKRELRTYFSKLLEVFEIIKSKLSEDGKIIVTFHHSNKDILMNFVNVFKKLQLNLDALYPVLGESSGKLSKRKIYLDLLFVFSKKDIETHFVPTNIYITNEDRKLMQFIENIVVKYNDYR